MLGLGAGSTLVPPTQGGREDLCFPTSPVELGAQAGTAKLLSPCTQGPLAWGNISPLNPAMAGWQHGLPAGTAANSEAHWSKGVQGEEGFRRDSCL
jgi:hypothetical protein